MHWWTYTLLALPSLVNLVAIWHAYKHDFPMLQEKIIWIMISVFLPVLGGLIYFFWGRKRICNKNT